MQDAAGNVRTNSWAMYSCAPHHADEQGLGDQQEPIYNSSVLIQDVAWKTSSERRLGKSMLVVHHDDDIYKNGFGIE